MNSIIDRTLINDFEISGLWWMPTNPKIKWFGTVIFKHDAIIRTELWADHDLCDKFDVLHGLSQNGERITLFDLTYPNKHTGFSQQDIIISASYATKYVVIGDHISSDIVFNVISVHYTYVEQWIRQPISPSSSLANILSINCGYSSTLGAHIEICRTQSISTSLTTWTKMLEWTIQFSFDQGHKYDELLQTVFDMANLLTVLFGLAVYPVYVEIKLKNAQSLTVYSSTIPKKILDDVHPSSFVVPFCDFMACASTIVPTWFDNLNVYRPVIGLYTATLFGSQFSEFNFLAIIQALEGYHRRKYPEKKYMDDDAYTRVIASWLSQLPVSLKQPHKDSLKTRIKYGNEYSLRTRFKKLFTIITQSETEAIVSNYGETRFIEKVIDTRNYLTHYTQELTVRAAQGKELIHLTKRLRVFLLLLILKDLNIVLSPEHFTKDLKWQLD
ncbi:hypothetical protein SAMN00768000_0321 [Sulfobacillus thermosulfidooxidans DSM 9293]|uniref:Uncharacterized protein n=1 Tax=Sulfobacillus thermosulfidooxidans (strain DSM 9293 / VKM B-1269 / AT-1) TaxID=929705 RepID=A0A1W1W755_SULTA|nr:HEPN domain-containing protein [Sulfobacillus thermosulfidooxidans]SMC02108.1 hypothetical protein SAMN00768000_0321 [Sulfobacillus thermosulfidooxidans DSM 9293]